MPFPDDLQLLISKRLGSQVLPQSFAADKDCYAGRIAEINFKGDNRMQFQLDGRKTGWLPVYPEELSWLETGLATPFELAVHYIMIRRARGAANKGRPVQSRLFD